MDQNRKKKALAGLGLIAVSLAAVYFVNAINLSWTERAEENILAKRERKVKIVAQELDNKERELRIKAAYDNPEILLQQLSREQSQQRRLTAFPLVTSLEKDGDGFSVVTGSVEMLAGEHKVRFTYKVYAIQWYGSISLKDVSSGVESRMNATQAVDYINQRQGKVVIVVPSGFRTTFVSRGIGELN